MESADLAAFLSQQLRVLSELAAELRLPEDALRWDQQSRLMQEALLEELWNGENFAARNPRTGELHASSSLLNLLPIALGDALPEEVRDRLAARLREHLTDWGLATEPLESPHYRPDGYWRGPIWAPSTVLVEDGLRRAGHVELADQVSARFRALCERSGFAENFDAVTGDGLRDRAYTWTASAYLLLAAAWQARVDAEEAETSTCGVVR
jgi:glycogen debranching enzyme